MPWTDVQVVNSGLYKSSDFKSFHEKAKDFKEAVRCYSRSIELNPTESFTYANRAMAYLKMQDYRKVVADAEKAIELKPGYLKAHHRRGKAYAALDEHDNAIKDF